VRPLRLLVSVAAASLVLAGCGSTSDDSASTSGGEGAGDGQYPLTIKHALGTTTIKKKPVRVATVNWANHEVPLALGVVPVGMAAANFGDDDGDGLLPWVSDKLDELGGEKPVLFDETDGIDFEAVSDTAPDVILASYSGLTQEDYDELSEIAPVVAYPEQPWATDWREMIELNSTAMGMADEGEKLVADLDSEIKETVAKVPALTDTSAMFLTHVDTTDLSEVSFYTTHDTRAKFFTDLGLKTPESIAEASKTTEKFSLTQSAEQVDALDDVDVIVTYGDKKMVEALKADPLLSKMPAVKNDAIVLLPDTPLGTAANPTPLSISYVLKDYVDMMAAAAAGA
jgi:iron complex transport system substrate-binding protein